MFADAAPVRAHRAGGMRFVDQQHGLMRFLTSMNRGRLGIVAIHAVHTFDGDQHAAIIATDFRQDFVERRANRCAETAAAGRRSRCCLE